jgi:hypothetical protein
MGWALCIRPSLRFHSWSRGGIGLGHDDSNIPGRDRPGLCHVVWGRDFGTLWARRGRLPFHGQRRSGRTAAQGHRPPEGLGTGFAPVTGNQLGPPRPAYLRQSPGACRPAGGHGPVRPGGSQRALGPVHCPGRRLDARAAAGQRASRRLRQGPDRRKSFNRGQAAAPQLAPTPSERGRSTRAQSGRCPGVTLAPRCRSLEPSRGDSDASTASERTSAQVITAGSHRPFLPRRKGTR